MTMINGFFTGEIEPDNTVCGCIDIFKNIWPDPKNTIEMLNGSVKNGSANWERAGTIGNGARQNARMNRLIQVTENADLSGDPLLQNIHNQFYTLLLATTIPYANRYDIHEGLWHEGYAALRYEGGEHYKAHYDGSTSIGRVISAICYLNDDYEGGEIEFVNFGVKIRPEPGTLVLFPSNFAYRHVAHPVKSGIKYALVTWLKDREGK